MHMLTNLPWKLLTLLKERENIASLYIYFFFSQAYNFTWLNNLAIMLIDPNESICEIVCGFTFLTK